MTAIVARWAIKDYHKMIEAGLLVDRRVELLNGLIVEMSPEGPDHADLSTDLLEYLISAANGRYRVRADKPITIATSNSEPEPDIALVKPQSYRQSHPTPADIYLIIEFANSSLTKDTQEKRLAYATAGIPEYWVVNLRDRQLIVYRNPANGDYQSEQRLTSGKIEAIEFPDVGLDVAVLFQLDV
ncbi:Uma2 family endonuclease [Leptolyngbya ohadii]|uniref:Uma2 family endonuclease n=1 Tax=Leptolyngbya ohadii TaxID=1962290 RepID=UPI000B59F566|nr:Uma2 family endonuclease [Leptolyngbya ohadii]